MNRSTTFLAVAVFCAATCLSQGLAHAQVRNRYNPYAAYAQGNAFQQSLAIQQLNAAQQGQVYGTNYGIPIYAASVANYYTPNYNSGYGANYYAPPVTPYAGGYANPYTPAAPGYGVNPYSPVDPAVANPYSPYNPYNPYSSNFGPGAVLQGTADIMRAYGTVVTSEQQAWLMKTKVDQEKLVTKKNAFDLEMYIKANTPTYNQDQERIAKATLRRIQTNSLPGEVSNGKSLNYLLDDLRKYPGKKISGDAVTFSEGILLHPNVSKGNFGMGVLREGLTWPSAVQELLNVNRRKELDAQLQAMVKKASRGVAVDARALEDVRKEIELLRADLVKKANEIPTPQYIDAKRFVQELYDGTRALENGEAKVQADFQRFIDGGKTVQEVADYLVTNGLRVAPATAADEAAYRAIHGGFASYNIAVNTQLGTEKE